MFDAERYANDNFDAETIDQIKPLIEKKLDDFIGGMEEEEKKSLGEEFASKLSLEEKEKIGTDSESFHRAMAQAFDLLFAV